MTHPPSAGSRDDDDLQNWIAQDYSLGELWEKNIFGGRPQ